MRDGRDRLGLQVAVVRQVGRLAGSGPNAGDTDIPLRAGMTEQPTVTQAGIAQLIVQARPSLERDVVPACERAVIFEVQSHATGSERSAVSIVGAERNGCALAREV